MSRPRKKLNLRNIERDYRTGAASVREIARRHDVSERSIRRRVQEGGWSPDLVVRTNEMVAEAIASQDPSNRFAAVPPVMPHDPFARASEDEFVAEAAAQKLAVIGRQKEDIARLLALHRAHAEAMSDLIELELASVGDVRDEHRKLLKIANILEIASRTLARLITIEGRVHKIDYAAEAKKLEPAQARVAVVAWKPRE